MSAEEPDDWKSRLKTYEEIIQAMSDPNEELLQHIESQLPTYLSDINPNCQKAALTICDTLFKISPPTNVIPITNALVDRCFGARQQNSDVACQIVLQCLKQEKEQVTDILFSKVTTKPPRHILSVLSVVVSHLATLTQKDFEEANDIMDRLKPLLQHNDQKIQHEARAAIASAKIITGAAFDTTDGGHQTYDSHESESAWYSQIQSDVWRERKDGYEKLLDCISEDFPYQEQESNIILAITNEKHVACNEVIISIIEKLALTFKTQLQRRLREYITTIINMLKEKRQSRFSNVTQAFDAVANNVSSSSPFDTPFVDYLISMLNSGSIKLREEGLNFIMRCEGKQLTPVLQEQLNKMTEDQAQSIRESVTKVLVKFGLQKAPEQQKGKNRSKSPDPKRQFKRKQSQKQLFHIWESWIKPETLDDLRSSAWNQVTDGLNQLKKQFEEDKNCPQAIITGLAKTFHNRTFTPKVMVNIVTDMLFYIKSDPSKITEESVLATLQFCLEKFQDKRLESQMFELIDNLCSCTSGQFVFSFFYNQLNVKSPVVLGRITSYFAQYLAKMDEKEEMDFEEFASQTQPLFTHSDPTVRKAAMDCYTAITSKRSDKNVQEYFKFVKPIEMRRTMPMDQILKKVAAELEANKDENKEGDATEDPKKSTKENETNNNNNPKSPTKEHENSDSDHKKHSKDSDSDSKKHSKDSDSDSKKHSKDSDSDSKKHSKDHDGKKSQIPQPGSHGNNPSASVDTSRGKAKQSVIPVLKRATSPKKTARPFTTPGLGTARSETMARPAIPQKLIQCIAKSASTLDNKKGFEEISSIISKLLDKKPPNSMSFTEFSSLYGAIEPWFKEYNSGIIQSVCKIIGGTLRLIRNEDAVMISQDFQCNMLLLLNFNAKSIRNSCIENMKYINDMLPDNSYITTVFLPMFPKLSAEGKIAGIKFLKDSNIELDVDTFSLFFVHGIANKSDEFKEAITPLLTQYLTLPGAVEALSTEAEQFPPAKKKTILQTISIIMKKEGLTEVPRANQSYFKQPPTNDELNDRKQCIDKFLILQILNDNEDLESLNDILQNYVEMYFRSSVMETNKEANNEAFKLFVDAATNEFDSFSLTLDIIFMWWSSQTIQKTKNSEDSSAINKFIRDILSILASHQRNLTQFEMFIIIPTLLDCTGRNNSKWEFAQMAAFKLCDSSQLISSLETFLANSTSHTLLEGTFRALMKLLINNSGASNHYPKLKEITGKVLEKLSKNKEENKVIYNIAMDFSSYIQRMTNPPEVSTKPPPRPKITSPMKDKISEKEEPSKDKEEEKTPSEPKKTPSEPPSPKIKEEKKESQIPVCSPREKEEKQQPPKAQPPESPKTRENSPKKVQRPSCHPNERAKEKEEPMRVQKSVCHLNDAVVSLSKGPTLHIYQWITELMTQNEESETKALKTIIEQLRTDASALKIHVTAIIEILLLKIHTYFTMQTPPTNTCKLILQCLTVLFGETKLHSLITKEFLQQLIYELITHISNGLIDSGIIEMINPLIVRIIDTCTIFSFMVLLAAVGEYESGTDYCDKWVLIAVMYFEMCGNKICEAGTKAEIFNANSLIDQFFEKHSPPAAGCRQICTKVYNSVMTFGQLLYSSGETAVESARRVGAIGTKITKPSSSSSAIVCPPHQYKLKPLRT